MGEIVLVISSLGDNAITVDIAGCPEGYCAGVRIENRETGEVIGNGRLGIKEFYCDFSPLKRNQLRIVIEE